MPSLQDFKQLRFDIDKEVWNRYSLSDGAELRIRTVLTKALKRITDKAITESDYSGEGTNLITVIPNKGYKLRGNPSKKPYTVDEISSASQAEVEFETISEDWNVYKLEDGKKLKTKLVVSSIKRRLVDIFDVYGIPMYLANSSVMINVSGLVSNTTNKNKNLTSVASRNPHLHLVLI